MSELVLTDGLRRTPVVDLRTGLMTLPWQRYFERLTVRVGGSIAPPADEVAAVALLAALAPYGEGAALDSGALQPHGEPVIGGDVSPRVEVQISSFGVEPI